VKESISRKNRQTATKSISTQNWESTVEFERLSRGVFCIDFVKKAASKQASSTISAIDSAFAHMKASAKLRHKCIVVAFGER